ncbi:MAG: tRNA (adenine(22)-N(1))-methyltransferase [Firmicutes bacterium]|nr:tRNA (adenine(22)-N(1))-methyltransferase [Bacillota bacterium]
MKLNPRLKAIADMVPPGSRIADIGTDHGYLPVYLIKTGRAIGAVVTDVSRGSLSKAVELVEAMGLQDKVETRLGNGLEVLKPGEVDTVIIAGMGGVLIRNILKDGAGVLEKAAKLLLQPMNAHEVVRKWLLENRFAIEDECLVREKEKIYQVMAAVHGEQKEDDSFYFEVGRRLIEKGDPLLPELARKKIKELSDIVSNLEDACTEEGQERRRECLERIRRYREVMETCS